MPNWVYNTLTVSGSNTDLAKLVLQVSKPFKTKQSEFQNNGVVQVDVEFNNPVFSFRNVIKPPDDESYYGDGTTANQGNWYDWNVRNWDTKWDIAVGDDSKYSDTQLQVLSHTSLEYRFSTAWSPAQKIVRQLSLEYPTLSFEYEYLEEQGWGGIEVWEYGSTIKRVQWDIPESHADYEKYQSLGFPVGSCICEVYDEVEDWYEDCPKPDDYVSPDEINNDNCLDPETLGTTTNGEE